MNTPTAFTVNFHGAEGNLDAKVVAPSGITDQAFIDKVDKGEFYQNETAGNRMPNELRRIKIKCLHSLINCIENALHFNRYLLFTFKKNLVPYLRFVFRVICHPLCTS